MLFWIAWFVFLCNFAIIQIPFRVFYFENKKLQGFSSGRKILVSLLSLLFHLQNRVSVFWNFNIWGIVHYVPEINFISQITPIKIKDYLSNKINYKKSETQSCRRKRAEDNNAKINVSPNIHCTFLLFKTSTFCQIFFPRILLFWQVLRTLVFLNSKCLIFLNLFIGKNTY